MKLEDISERDALIYTLGCAQAASVIAVDSSIPTDYKIQIIRDCFFPAVKLFDGAPQVQPAMQRLIDLAIRRAIEALADGKQREVCIELFQMAVGKSEPDLGL